MRIKKTLFGNYRAKEVEAYIEVLRQAHDRELDKKNEKIAALHKKVEAAKNQEKEIGEAIVHAKSLIIEAHEKAEKEAQRVLEEAQKDYLDTRTSILKEIDELTQKRQNTEDVYEKGKSKIKETLREINELLDKVELVGEKEKLSEKVEKIREFEKKLEATTTSSILNFEKQTAKTGTDDTVPVTYPKTDVGRLKKKEDEKAENDKTVRRLSRIPQDDLLQ